METGVVKWFDNKRGYGFISGQNGSDAFVHYSQVKEKTHRKDLHEGQEVMYDTIVNERGIQAINVQKV